ncbi:MAG TPA: peptidoglycan-binding protein [Xanthobacteraceae bacterium]|nr:peptidoglycan-binding protein [Xanthobacteraceae bacterium]
MPDLDATYRSIAVDRDRFDDDRSLWRAALARVLGRNPRDAIALAGVAVAVGAILVNALHLQPGPHPAPIFKIRPRPVATAAPANALASLNARPADVPGMRADAGQPVPRSRVDIIADMQRELAKRDFYDGPADGISGPKTDAAIRDFIQAAGLKVAAEPTEDLLRALARSPVKAPPARGSGTATRIDPIAELIAPSPKRVLAVQRALAEAGYAQIRPTGVFGPETQAAIEKFERDRKLPITGEISDRLVRELAGLTGQPLE